MRDPKFWAWFMEIGVVHGNHNSPSLIDLVVRKITRDPTEISITHCSQLDGPHIYQLLLPPRMDTTGSLAISKIRHQQNIQLSLFCQNKPQLKCLQNLEHKIFRNHSKILIASIGLNKLPFIRKI